MSQIKPAIEIYDVLHSSEYTLEGTSSWEEVASNTYTLTASEAVYVARFEMEAEIWDDGGSGNKVGIGIQLDVHRDDYNHDRQLRRSSGTAKNGTNSSSSWGTHAFGSSPAEFYVHGPCDIEITLQAYEQYDTTTSKIRDAVVRAVARKVLE